MGDAIIDGAEAIMYAEDVLHYGEENMYNLKKFSTITEKNAKVELARQYLNLPCP